MFNFQQIQLRFTKYLLVHLLKILRNIVLQFLVIKRRRALAALNSLRWIWIKSNIVIWHVQRLDCLVKQAHHAAAILLGFFWLRKRQHHMLSVLAYLPIFQQLSRTERFSFAVWLVNLGAIVYDYIEVLLLVPWRAGHLLLIILRLLVIHPNKWLCFYFLLVYLFLFTWWAIRGRLASRRLCFFLLNYFFILLLFWRAFMIRRRFEIWMRWWRYLQLVGKNIIIELLVHPLLR